MKKVIRMVVNFQTGTRPVASFNMANEDADGLLSGAGSHQIQLDNSLAITLPDGTVLDGQQIRQALRALSEVTP